MLYPDMNLQKRTQQSTTRYRTALYLRLSREDGDKTESDSIANQRTLLEAYAADHPELCIVDEFVDDGYSGSNFERPAFQNLFRELEQGTINCILVKDLSRFGRNYIEVGRYLERIFPVMRVRLIAVTDNYDSQSAWKTSDVPMRDWTIVDNTHEAIVPAEQFELVQRILETETRRPNDAETVALFAGFLYCGDCGSRLVRRSASYKGKRYIYYQCSGSKQNKGSCTSHNLRDEKLHNIVRNALQMQIQIVMEEAEFVESIRQAQQEPYRVRRIERQIRQLTAEKAHTQGIKEKLYGDYAEEILTREDFLNYNELYSKRIEEYERKITELEAEQQNLQTAPNAYPFLDVYRKYRKLEEITRPMVVELIEKIEVYEGNRVEITFRFHDEIADLLEELHQKQMGQREVSA